MEMFRKTISAARNVSSYSNNNNVVIPEVLLQINNLHRLQNSATKSYKEVCILFFQQPQQL
jgi:hypothetical protein